MRYWAAMICILFAGVAFGYNETVSAISYNPSRTGVYTKFKVLKKATFKGGLETNQINVWPVKDKNNVDGKVTINAARKNTEDAIPVAYIDSIDPAQDANIGIELEVESGKKGPIVQGKPSDPNSLLNVIPSDSSYGVGIPVTLYDGTLTATEDSYVTNGFAVEGVAAELSTLLEKVEVQAATLAAKEANSGEVNVSGSLKLGNVTVSEKPTGTLRWEVKDSAQYLCYQ